MKRRPIAFAPSVATIMSSGALALGCALGDDARAEREENLATARSSVIGTPDTSSDFAVGVIDSESRRTCSGTLVAPNLVLTARACVTPKKLTGSCTESFGAPSAASSIAVTTGLTISNDDAAKLRAREVVVPSKTSLCGNDLALLVLEANVPPSRAKAAVPLVQLGLGDARLAKTVTAIGYGRTAPSAPAEYRRNIRQNIKIVCAPGVSAWLCPGGAAGLAVGDLLTEGFVCEGDSGSGAFDQSSFSAGNPFVIGTLSRGAPDCTLATYTRTDSHAALIVATAIRAAQLGGYAAPSWTEAQPSTPPPPPPPAATGKPPAECPDGDCDRDRATPGGADEAATEVGADEQRPSAGCGITSWSPGSSASDHTLLVVAAAMASGARRRARQRARARGPGHGLRKQERTRPSSPTSDGFG